MLTSAPWSVHVLARGSRESVEPLTDIVSTSDLTILVIDTFEWYIFLLKRVYMYVEIVYEYTHMIYLDQVCT